MPWSSFSECWALSQLFHSPRSLIPINGNIHSCHLLFDHFRFPMIHGLNIPGSYAILFFTALDFTFTARHILSWVLSLHWLSLFVPSGAVCLLFSSVILDTYWHGGSSCGMKKILWDIFVFSHCSWGSQGKNAEAVCLSFLQWTMFCQNPPAWSVCLGWPCMTWLIVLLS